MSDIWEHFKGVKLVTKPEVRYAGRRCWFQDNTVYIGRAEGDMVAYQTGMEIHRNFIPRNSGPIKMRPGRGLTIRNKMVLRLIGYHPFDDTPAHVEHSVGLWLQIIAWRLWKRPIR